MNNAEIEIFEEEGEKTLSFSDKDRYTTLDFFPEKKEFRQTSGIYDDVDRVYEVYEYKINTNPIGVFVRLKQRYTEPSMSWYVKDRVVLEAELRDEEKKEKCKWPYFLEKLIDGLKNDIEWHKIDLWWGYAEVFYILSLHPEIISHDEYKQFLRQTDQRIKLGLNRIEEYLNKKDKTGLKIIEREYGKYFWYPEEKDLTDDEIEKKSDYIENNFNILLFDEKSPSYCGISKDEFQESSATLKHLEYLFNRNEAYPIETSSPKISKTKEIIISVLLTLSISWTVSLFVDINPFLIFILVQLIAFFQSILGAWVGKLLTIKEKGKE